jgi:hypothetical protein
VLRDEEPRRDLVRAQVAVEEQQHLELARAQHLRDRLRHLLAAAALTHLVEQPARNRARERRLALRDAAQERHDPVRRLALQQVAGGAAADRAEEVALVLRRRQHDDLRLRRGLAQPRQRREPVHLGHREVEQDQVRLELARGRDRLLPARRLADHVEPVLGEQPRERLACQRVVVDDEDALGHVLARLCR